MLPTVDGHVGVEFEVVYDGLCLLCVVVGIEDLVESRVSLLVV